jgi:hypothetical protein
MKKIGLTLAAVAALGLAACGGSNNEAGNNTADVNATELETGNDVNASVNEAEALNSTNSALDSVGNAASDVGNAVGNASDAGNAVTNAAD